MNAASQLSVSVVMATYNGTKYLREQIESVLRQLQVGDELVIVDDGSSDTTVALIESFGSPLIRLHRNPRNLGVLRTFERALNLSCNEVIFFCDQDDVWADGKREAFVAEFMRDPACMVVISDAQVIDGHGTSVRASFMADKGGFRGGALSTILRNRYLGCAMAVRRRVLGAALPIPACVPMHDMWFGAIGSLIGRVAYIREPLLQYRRHGNNVSPARRSNWLQVLRWRADLVRALAGRWGVIRSQVTH